MDNAMRPVPSHAPTNETTTLSPEEEARFRAWVAASQIPDADSPQSYYDYRGFWKEFGDKPVRFGVDHFTDTYKRHGHPLFSNESKYATGPGDGGRWAGEALIEPPVASHDSGGLLAALRLRLMSGRGGR